MMKGNIFNKSEFICLHTVNGFEYTYLTLISLFYVHNFLHPVKSFQVFLSSTNNSI